MEQLGGKDRNCLDFAIASEITRKVKVCQSDHI